MKSFALHALLLTLLLIGTSAKATADSTDYLANLWFTEFPHKFPGERPACPIPEPSAALVFAVGLLAAAPKLRRKR